jgi:hypothetical protein
MMFAFLVSDLGQVGTKRVRDVSVLWQCGDERAWAVNITG